jgi:outer membrane lipoprotein-sorting protein
MPRTIRLGLLTLLLHAASAQPQPDVAEILRKVSETYKAASQYEFVVDLKVRDEETGKPTTGHALFAFKSPNRYRAEGAIPGMSADLAAFGQAVIVHDGSAVWVYLPKSNQYTSIPISAMTADAPGDLGDLRPEAMDNFMMGRYRGAAQFAQGAKFLREEAIGVAGAQTDCYVLSISQKQGGPAYTWWVDRKRYVILREDLAGSSSVFTAIKLSEQLPDDLFKFEPPPGSRKLEIQR